MSKKIEVFILTHKKFEEPYDSSIYKPLVNGADSKEDTFGYLCDNVGDNISKLNNQYSELSGEYWAWKNSNADIIGFCHYRRWFVKNTKWKKLTGEEISDYLDEYDIIVPEKRKEINGVYKEAELRYGREPTAEVNPIEYKRLGKVIKNNYPEYFPAYEKIMKGNYNFLHNMFICDKKLADEYFEWIFNVFEDLMPEIDFSIYPYNSRVFGYLSERLLTVFIEKKGLKYKELPLYMSESKIPLVALFGSRHPGLLDIQHRLKNLF